MATNVTDLGTRLARLPVSLQRHVVPQRHDEYTRDEHDVWACFFERYRNSTRELAHRVYKPHLAGLECLQLPADQLPSVELLTERLASTSWITVCVDGYLPVHVYAAFIAQRIFPISREIRHAKHIDFSPIPDLVHDVFGHLPLLFDATHRTYLRELGRVASQARPSGLDNALHVAHRRMGALRSDPHSPQELVTAAEQDVADVQRQLLEHPSRITELSRLFLWSIEFGLIGTKDDYLVQGAGLLSSLAETAFLFSPGVNVEPYTIEATRRDILFSDFQEHYYVFSSYAELTSVLEQYERRARVTAAHQPRLVEGNHQ